MANKLEFELDGEREKRKKAIFDAMGQRNQQAIIKKGYEKWDPFQDPKDPIELRDHKSRLTSQVLIREFLQQASMEEYSNEYGKAAFDMCLGLVNKDEKFIAMYDFACWYRERIKDE